MNYIGFSALVIILLGIVIAFEYESFGKINDDTAGYSYVLSDVYLYTFYPYRVICRCDNVYVSDEKVHTLLIKKSRTSSAVFDADVAEISLCAWVYRENGKIVENFGYIVIKNTLLNETCTFRVDFYTDTVCLRLLSFYFKKSTTDI